jgi:hypothetical protein
MESSLAALVAAFFLPAPRKKACVCEISRYTLPIGGTYRAAKTEDATMADTFALMNNGLFYGMSDQQEHDARRHQARTVPYDDGSWGWSADIGEGYGFASEEEAWDSLLSAIADGENEA